MLERKVILSEEMQSIRQKLSSSGILILYLPLQGLRVRQLEGEWCFRWRDQGKFFSEARQTQETVLKRHQTRPLRLLLVLFVCHNLRVNCCCFETTTKEPCHLLTKTSNFKMSKVCSKEQHYHNQRCDFALCCRR